MTENIWKIISCVWIVWNIVTFSLMGIDKLKAGRGSWRISEKTLLITAFAMGAVGSLLGSYLFNHKTSKKRFRFGIPAALLVNIAVIALVARLV